MTLTPLRSVALLAVFIASSAGATIPAAAKSDPRYKLGYLVVTYYPGVDSRGLTDSTAGLQQALRDAAATKIPLLFPSGVYLISDTLKAYDWTMVGDYCCGAAYTLIGSTLGTQRPIIRLAHTAPAFDHVATPRPLLAMRKFQAVNTSAVWGAQPSDPLYGLPDNFGDGSAGIFGWELRGIDFDTGGHPGAVGVTFAAAQDSSMENVRVVATGSYGGIFGVPGRDDGAANIEVEGGQVGLRIYDEAGATLVGVTLSNQTRVAIQNDDFVPTTMAGFLIRGAVAPVMTNATFGSAGTATLLDGVVELKAGGTAFSNPTGNNLYLRNIYISGTADLVQSAALPPVTGRGGWVRLAEYSYTGQAEPSLPYPANAKNFRSFNMVNGVVDRVPEKTTRVVNNSLAPPDLVHQHLWESLPSYEGQSDGTQVVTRAPYDAKGDDTSDDLAALQSAIDWASAHGNGKVFLPVGSYRISNTLRLHANTALFGASRKTARIAVHPNWKPTIGQVPVIQTDDVATATTFLGFLTVAVRTAEGGTDSAGANLYDRFEVFNWRAGRHSATLAVEAGAIDWAPGNTNPHDFYRFEGNGGGRHYFLMSNSYTCLNLGFRGVRVAGTHEPLWFYGLNSEDCKAGGSNWDPDANVEVDGASNVRILSMKREGETNTLIVRDSTNVALYSTGVMHSPPLGNSTQPMRRGGYVQVLGASAGVLMTNLDVAFTTDGPNGEATLRESFDGGAGVWVTWPDGVTVYKRGELNDSAASLPLAEASATLPLGTGANPDEVVVGCESAGASGLGHLLLLALVALGWIAARSRLARR
jgi:hypothetical protein